jgi:hypothetical protein
MISLKRAFFISIFITINTLANCQTGKDLKLVSHAEDFKIQERVLLAVDQDFYLTGEPINFLALTFDAALQIPIEFSSVLYVELFNQDNKVISAKKYLLKHGEAVNDIVIPRQVETGYYYLRAYTNYMKNFGAGVFFTKRLKIVNPFYKNSDRTNSDYNPGEMKLDIVAEGGSIIYEVENKIAFSNSNFNERALVKLFENNTELSKVETKTGFGVFNLTPKAGKNYRIEAVSPSGGKAVVELKDIVNAGVVCKLDSVKKSNAYLKVVSRNYNKFPLSIYVENNSLLFESEITVNERETYLKVELPTRLNKIVLRNREQEIVTERLIYIRPEPKFEISAELDKPNVIRGDTISIHIKTNSDDSLQYLVGLNLGSSKTSPTLQELIESSLYASSIASFTNNVYANELEYLCSDAININDYVLKFQNARNVNLKITPLNYLPEINQDIITGSVRKRSDQSLAGNKRMYLAFVDSICWINRCNTDGSGKFASPLPLDFQGTDLVVTVKDTIDNYMIKIDDEFYPDFLKVAKEDYYPDSTLRKVIESRMINIQVNEAYSEQYKSNKSPRADLRFYGQPDKEYEFRKYVNLPKLEEFVFEIVKPAIIVKRGRLAEIKVLVESTHNIIGENPLIIFDGIPLLKSDNLTSVASEKLESIRVISSKFFFGPDVYDGIIDITSNNKSFDLVEMDKNSIKIKFTPTIAWKDNRKAQNSWTPNYVSDAFFDKINSTTGNTDITVHLPQNEGNYSLSVFGFTKSGAWGSLVLPNVLTIKH